MYGLSLLRIAQSNLVADLNIEMTKSKFCISFLR